MHQRHIVTDAAVPAPCCANHQHQHQHQHHGTNTNTNINNKATASDDEDAVPTIARTAKTTQTRRRRKTRSWWPFGSTRRSLSASKKHNTNPAAVLFDEANIDLLATFLQILSVTIMIGCAVTLLSQAISTSSDMHSSSVWSWVWPLTSMGKTMGGIARGIGGGGRHQSHPYGMGLNAHYPKTPLMPSTYYEIPGSMSHLGDKSDRYALLRKEIDAKAASGELLDTSPKLSLTPITTAAAPSAKEAYASASAASTAVPYDIYNCPDEPPEGYPFAWNLLQLLNAWPPDDPTPRPQVHQGLCVFDYVKDLQKAYAYRAAEVPFVIRGDPQVQQAVQRWNTPDYLSRLLGKVAHRTEYSASNHFLYWNPPPRQRDNAPRPPNGADPRAGFHKNGQGQGGNRLNKDANNPMGRPSRFLQKQQNTPPDWKPPTEMMRMTYDDWLLKANLTDDSQLGPAMPHWYFRLIGCGETGPEGQCDNGSSEYLFDELTFFQPKESIYMTDPSEQKGIHCRFGMKGVIAENHFDGSRNMIVVLGGERRYILSHPEQCPFLSLLPKGHPSARHSAVDWSDPDLDAYPEFALAKGNEVVLQAGDVLYLPTNWFHYIISLSVNFQCNTRSGTGQDYMEPIHHCGF